MNFHQSDKIVLNALHTDSDWKVIYTNVAPHTMLGGVRGRQPNSALTVGYLGYAVISESVGKGRSTTLMVDAAGRMGLEKLPTPYTAPSAPQSKVSHKFF